MNINSTEPKFFHLVSQFLCSSLRVHFQVQLACAPASQVTSVACTLSVEACSTKAAIRDITNVIQSTAIINL